MILGAILKMVDMIKDMKVIRVAEVAKQQLERAKLSARVACAYKAAPWSRILAAEKRLDRAKISAQALCTHNAAPRNFTLPWGGLSWPLGPPCTYCNAL